MEQSSPGSLDPEGTIGESTSSPKAAPKSDSLQSYIHEKKTPKQAADYFGMSLPHLQNILQIQCESSAIQNVQPGTLQDNPKTGFQFGIQGCHKDFSQFNLDADINTPNKTAPVQSVLSLPSVIVSSNVKDFPTGQKALARIMPDQFHGNLQQFSIPLLPVLQDPTKPMFNMDTLNKVPVVETSLPSVATVIPTSTPLPSTSSLHTKDGNLNLGNERQIQQQTVTRAVTSMPKTVIKVKTNDSNAKRVNHNSRNTARKMTESCRNITISIPHFNNSLAESFHQLQRNGNLCDVIILGKDDFRIKVHSVILAAMSKKFCSHFSKGLSSTYTLDLSIFNEQELNELVDLFYKGFLSLSQDFSHLTKLYNFLQHFGLSEPLALATEHVKMLFAKGIISKEKKDIILSPSESVFQVKASEKDPKKSVQKNGDQDQKSQEEEHKVTDTEPEITDTVRSSVGIVNKHEKQNVNEKQQIGIQTDIQGILTEFISQTPNAECHDSQRRKDIHLVETKMITDSDSISTKINKRKITKPKKCTTDESKIVQVIKSRKRKSSNTRLTNGKKVKFDSDDNLSLIKSVTEVYKEDAKKSELDQNGDKDPDFTLDVEPKHGSSSKKTKIVTRASTRISEKNSPTGKKKRNIVSKVLSERKKTKTSPKMKQKQTVREGDSSDTEDYVDENDKESQKAEENEESEVEDNQMLKLSNKAKYSGRKRLRAVCKVCKSKFDTVEEVKIHEKTCNLVLKFYCRKCSKRFATEEEVNSHKPSCPSRKYNCRVCKQCHVDFETPEKLKEHQDTAHKKIYKKRSASNRKRQKCDYCDYTCRNDKQKYQHLFKKHDIPLENHEQLDIFKCEMAHCSYKTVYRESFENHMKAHKNIRPHMCEICGRSFVQKSHLNTHLKDFHCEDGQHHPCENCDFVALTKSSLHAHRYRYHKEQQKHMCEVCSYTTPLKSCLHQHQYLVHDIPLPEKGTYYHCKYCKYVTPWKNIYLNHVRRHSGECPFQCQYCGKKFPAKSDLTSHAKWHQDDSKIPCPYEGCSYKNPSKHQLSKHIKNMHTEKDKKPFVCHVCDYKTGLKGNLTLHLRKVHKLEVQTNLHVVQKIPEAAKDNETDLIRDGLVSMSVKAPQEGHDVRYSRNVETEVRPGRPRPKIAPPRACVKMAGQGTVVSAESKKQVQKLAENISQQADIKEVKNQIKDHGQTKTQKDVILHQAQLQVPLIGQVSNQQNMVSMSQPITVVQLPFHQTAQPTTVLEYANLAHGSFKNQAINQTVVNQTQGQTIDLKQIKDLTQVSPAGSASDMSQTLQVLQPAALPTSAALPANITDQQALQQFQTIEYTQLPFNFQEFLQQRNLDYSNFLGAPPQPQ